MKVQALRQGYYDNKRRREGDVFDIKGKHEHPRRPGKTITDFSGQWMVALEEEAPVVSKAVKPSKPVRKKVEKPSEVDEDVI